MPPIKQHKAVHKLIYRQCWTADGGWCTIYHLSASHGTSFNFIDLEQYSLSYCTVDDVLPRQRSTYGKNRLKECIPPYPSKTRGLESARDMLEKQVLHRHLLALRSWLRPYLFNQLSTTIHWILQHKYHIHRSSSTYLDDFFTAGSPDSSECSNNLTAMLSL